MSKVNEKPVLGSIMRDARRRAGVTQDELAIRSGIAAPSISRIENGRESPSFERFAVCMQALGFEPHITLSELGGSEADPVHLAAEAQMTPSQRLESLIEWNAENTGRLAAALDDLLRLKREPGRDRAREGVATLPAAKRSSEG